jgi:hypothetical protein
VVDAGDRIVVEQLRGPDGPRLQARVIKAEQATPGDKVN